ncbi:MAG: hypothetical protein AB1553_01870 [Nitrospirota bacterium]
MMDNLDLLIETSTVQGQLDAGISPSVVAARSSLGTRGVAVLSGKKGETRKAKMPSWTPEEDKFLETYLGILSEEEIAEALGRTYYAVHVRWKRDLALRAPSKRPDVLTGNQVAYGLGIDIHSAMHLIDRGILPGWELPSVRRMRIVRRIVLLQFITNPLNWCYFKPERVGRAQFSPKTMLRKGKAYDVEFWEYARRLVLKRKSLWKDEWWRIGEVARYHGVDHSLVNKYIHDGVLKATDWGNWWILKSHAMDPSLHFVTGKGRKGVDVINVSQRAEAFIVLAEAVGLMESEIAALMTWKEKRITYLKRRLREQGRIPQIIKENNLKVYYNKKTEEVYADWKKHRDRFPRLSKLMGRRGRPGRRSRVEAKYINRVKRKAEVYREWKSRR